MKTRTTLILIMMLISGAILSQIIHIPADQPTIQDGINAASDGDTVLVAEGTYLENIRFFGKAIIVASEYIMDGDSSHIVNTVIDGSNAIGSDTAAVVLFIDGEDTTSVINGFTITGGTGVLNMTWQMMGGGGVYSANNGCKIINNIIKENHVQHENIAGGAGIFCYNEADESWVVIRRNDVGYNTAEANGFSAFGGGMSVLNNCKIEDNIIEHNSCTNTSGNADGGGIELEAYYNHDLKGEVRNNVIRNNVIESSDVAMGAGIRSWLMTTKLIGNIIENNECYASNSARGSGIWIVETDSTVISDNIIQYNLVQGIETLGCGIYSWKNNNMLVDNNTIINNTSQATNGWGGGCASLGSTIFTFSNNVLRNNKMNCSAFWFGSGIWINTPNDQVIINKNVFENNTGTTVYNWSLGGAIGVIKEYTDSLTIIAQNTMKGHNPERGGALWTGNVYNLKFENNLILNNHASDFGGGICMEDLDLRQAGSIFAPESFTNNENQVFREQELHASIVNNTFLCNSAEYGGAIDVSDTYETPVIFNNIFWQNTADVGIDINSQYQKQLLISYNDIDLEGIIHPWTGEGNMLCNPAMKNDSMHLYWPSLCVNAGIESLEFEGRWYYSPVTDIDGETRPFDWTTPDIGADEAQWYYVSVGEALVPNNLVLKTYPNPISTSTTIEYELEKPTSIQLVFYNHLGERVQLINEYQPQGNYNYNWHVENLPSGIYYCVLKTDYGTQTAKMIKVK